MVRRLPDGARAHQRGWLAGGVRQALQARVRCGTDPGTQPRLAQISRGTRGHSLSGVWDHLDVAVEELGDVAVVHLAGELDVHTAGKLARHLGAISTAVDRIVIDVGRVDFMDTLGLNVVLSARTRAQTEGTALRLENPPPPVLRLLERTGVDRLLCGPFEASADDEPADQLRLI